MWWALGIVSAVVWSVCGVGWALRWALTDDDDPVTERQIRAYEHDQRTPGWVVGVFGGPFVWLLISYLVLF